MRHALVAVQLLVVAFYLQPAVGEELVRGLGGSAELPPPAAGSIRRRGVAANRHLGGHAHGNTLGSLAPGGINQRLLLAATLPCLIAGRFAGDLAVASALRWGVAVCFLIVSAAIWERNRLLRACRLAHTNLDLDFSGLPVAQHVAIWTTAVPVLGLTVVAAACLFSGIEPGGPAAGTLFAWFGPKVSYLVPLVLVLLALVGHALRESSAGYAFFAGLVGELAVTLGYALSVVLAGRSFAADEWATLLQLATITAAAWALGWLAARRWVDVCASMPPADRKRPPRFLDRGNQRQVLPPPRV